MKPQNMFGVVLWSDAAARKAVIWCEDQGELAYYAPAEECIHDAPALDPGDLIRFDMIIQQNIRKARNPQVLMQSHSPDLAGALLAGAQDCANDARPLKPKSLEKVVSLADYFDIGAPAKVALSG